MQKNQTPLEDDNLVLTETDRKILQSYSAMLDGLSEYLGEGYEIVLHSLEDHNRSVIALKNGHYSGREIGSPITDLAISMLKEINNGSHNTDHLAYFNTADPSNPKKSITIAIRGENDRIIGLLCMNMYLNTPFYKIVTSFSPLGAMAKAEHFTNNTDDLLAGILEEARETVNHDSSISPNLKNKAIVYLMAGKGAFKLKNSVTLTARALGISTSTVYLHLRAYQEEADQ